jgi:glyoxylase-like metal-dependent hydrolase (beta-lactamase superfamily II)
MKSKKKLKIEIFPGNLLLRPEEHPYEIDFQDRFNRGFTGASTVIYITDGKTHLICDTGFGQEANQNLNWKTQNLFELGFQLKNRNIDSESIDYVFITHWHRDHFGSISLFNNAKILTAASMFEIANFKLLEEICILEEIEKDLIIGLGEGEHNNILEGLSVLETPGHSKHDVTLLIKKATITEKEYERIAITGDIILDEEAYHGGTLWKHNSDFFSEEIQLESIKKIKERAKWVIPGHGDIFKIE